MLNHPRTPPLHRHQSNCEVLSEHYRLLYGQEKEPISYLLQDLCPISAGQQRTWVRIALVLFVQHYLQQYIEFFQGSLGGGSSSPEKQGGLKCHTCMVNLLVLLLDGGLWCCCELLLLLLQLLWPIGRVFVRFVAWSPSPCSP